MRFGLFGFPLWMLLSGLLVSATASAQIIVDESFDAYVFGNGDVDQFAFENIWIPDAGDGRSPTTVLPPPFSTQGVLVPDTTGEIEPPFNNPPGLTGVGVHYANFTLGTSPSINEYDGDGDNNNVDTPAFEVAPTVEKNVFVAGDIYHNGVTDSPNGERQTIGLRNDTIQRIDGSWGFNFLELGFYNAATFDPTDPANAPPNDPTNDQPATDFAYRIVLWGPAGGDLVRNPNWQYFDLPPEFDDPVVDHNDDGVLGNGDGIVNVADVGPGWHRFSAEVSDTGITLNLDLFRDGTIDASQEWEIEMFDDPETGEPAPFTSLRIGSPSGIGGNEDVVFDNILLELLDVAAGFAADFDKNGSVDGDDFLIWQQAFGTQSGATSNTGDANGDGAVDGDDFLLWQQDFGSSSGQAGAAIPEPATWYMAAWIMLLTVTRRTHTHAR